MIDVNREVIKERDWVRLKYANSSRIPQSLDGNWAKVVKKERQGYLVVQAMGDINGFTRTIELTDISDHRKPLALNFD